MARGLSKIDTTTSYDLPIKQVIATLGKSLREYKAKSIFAMIFQAGEVVGECAIPFFTAGLIDHIKHGSTPDEIARYGVILIVVASLAMISGTIAGIFGSKAACGLAKNLRHDMFYNIQTFSHENIGKFSTASLVTRLTTDTTNVQQSYMMSIIMLSRGPLMFFFAIIMAYKMAGNMAFIYLVVAPCLAFALGLLIKIVLPILTRVFKRYDELNLTINENIHGIRTVKSYVREDLETQKFETATHNLFVDFRIAEKILALANPAVNIAISVIFMFVIYVGSKTIITSHGTALDVGQFSALVTYGFMILFSLVMISMMFANLTLAEESARRIDQVLNEVATIKNPEHPVYEVKDGSVQFKDVSFKYSSSAARPVLSHINLSIPSGATVGIIGATGSAKTSLAQLILRLYDPTEGEVLVGGVNTRDYDLDTLRNAVALVEQKSTLFSGTVADNLRWGCEDATMEQIKEVAKIACADEFIDTMPQGYETQIAQGGTNVSGGQKQRLCIARALLKHPKILIFDDSTSAVDTKTDAKIREGLRSFAPDTTKITIAQRISSVKDADMIVVLDSGHVVDCADHETLLKTNEIYRETYISQTKQSDEEGDNRE